MIIVKQYKFYAAHRNELLSDKCRNLHGHRYGLRCFFEVERDGAITTLFGEFDTQIEPFLKQHYDHALLIHVGDPLYPFLCEFTERTGEQLRMKRFDRPTSVENLCHMLFSEITDLGFRLQSIEVQETDTSVVHYTREDWIADSRIFAAEQEQRESLPLQDALSVEPETAAYHLSSNYSASKPPSRCLPS